MSTALKKIRARVKQLQKKNPHAHYKNLQKQAGKEFKSGKLKTVGKRKPAKKKAAKRKVAKRTVAIIHHAKPAPRKLHRRKRRSVGAAVASHRRRRVSGSGSNLMPIVAIGGLAVLAYFLLKPRTTTLLPSQIPGLVTTGNAARDNSAANIVAYATAAGIAATALSKLIDSINNSSDSTVTAAAGSADPTQYFTS